MREKHLVWAIDCDDVIVPTAQVIIDAYNDEYGKRVQLEDFYNDRSSDVWGTSTHQEAVDRVSGLLRKGIASDVAPSDETIDALKHLASLDELHLVTGRQSYLELATKAMLRKYLPSVFSSVEHTNYLSDSENMVKTRTKGEVCQQIGADVLIDDHIAHGQSVIDYGVKEVIVWGDYPWNQNQQLTPGMVRCVSWKEVFDERERILAGR